MNCCNIILFVILLIIVNKLLEINIFSFQLPDWATENGGLGTMNTFARRQVLIFFNSNFFQLPLKNAPALKTLKTCLKGC